jgi:spore coat protein U domain-containing protein, fimbrial subunit CupE1/2/3/6
MRSTLLTCALVMITSVAHSATCKVSTSGLNFGSYNVFNTVSDDITATITLKCTTGAPYSISLSSGSGTYASRTMTNAAKKLLYNLYVDATHLTIWGDGSSGTGIFSGTGSGVNVGITIYGRVPARQNASVGSYTDSVTVTVTF